MDNVMDTYIKALKFTSKWEGWDMPNGGYVNDPADPGGETKYGISKKEYPTLDIKNLTRADANAIFFRDYWIPVGCADLELGLAIATFDSAVNTGKKQTKRWLGWTSDWKKFNELRTQFYYRLVDQKPQLKKFQKGWINRMNDLKTYIALCLEEQHQSTVSGVK